MIDTLEEVDKNWKVNFFALAVVGVVFDRRRRRLPGVATVCQRHGCAIADNR
jgi:hypothetical protein